MVLKRLPKIIDLVLAVLKIRPCKQGSGSGGNRRRRSPVEYRGNLYVCLYLHKAVRPSCERPASASEGLKGRTYVRMYVHTDVQIPPVFYRTSSPSVPSGAAAQKGMN